MTFRSQWDSWVPATGKSDKTQVTHQPNCIKQAAETAKTDSVNFGTSSQVEIVWAILRKMADEKVVPRVEGGQLYCRPLGGSLSDALRHAITAHKPLLILWLESHHSKLRDHEIEVLARAFTLHRQTGPYQIYAGGDICVCFERSLVIAPDGYVPAKLLSLFPYRDESILYEQDFIDIVVEPSVACLTALASTIILPARPLEPWFSQHLNCKTANQGGGL